MAQLTDDCFAFGGELMPVDAALALIAERITPVAGVEMVKLRQHRCASHARDEMY